MGGQWGGGSGCDSPLQCEGTVDLLLSDDVLTMNAQKCDFRLDFSLSVAH